MLVWKAVPNFGAYSVSNKGKIRRGSKLIKQHLKKGYFYVGLYNENGRKNLSVSRIVGAAFLPNPLLLPEVNHIDGNKRNNRVSNLGWMSSEDNRKHALSLGLINKGQRRKRAREVKIEV